MDQVQALIAKTDKLAAHALRFESAVTCPLVQGYSLLPITDALAKALAGYQWSSEAALTHSSLELPDGLNGFACEISHDCPVAYINTYYFGGHGGQDALVFDKGRLGFSPATDGYNHCWPDSSISQALRAIGVEAEVGKDAFDTVGLGAHRETHRWAASAK
jgi:hypothetical protein